MDFLDKLDTLIPDYLSEERKNRLKDGLKQFRNKDVSPKLYTDFYSKRTYDFFLQGDLLRQLRFPIFDYKSGTYSKKYLDAIIISNTCDIDNGNKREIIKRVILAQAIPLKEYIKDLEKNQVNNLDEKVKQIRNQLYTNLLYLPPTLSSKEDYIVLLDGISEISIEELNSLLDDLPSNRIEVLDHFGYYLFIFKLSYHLCRLPESHYRK